jgi:hypothetical protein
MGAMSTLSASTPHLENNMSHHSLQAAAMFEVRYLPLTADQRSLSFPCDDGGHVDLNALSKRALSDYLFARALVGRVYGPPQIGCIQ